MTSNPNMITSAFDDDDKRVPIDRAIKGLDYYRRDDHPECVLRPVKPLKRQSHFRHKGRRPDCPDWQNESAEHERIKTDWFNFLEQQLSGCFVCVVSLDHVLDRDPHRCPTNISGKDSVNPWYDTILWVCDQCSKPHIYDLLQADDSVRTEEWAFGRSCRPDITITDASGIPKSFIEFRKSSSGKSREVADKRGIPWFEIDVFEGEDFGLELINDTRRYWESLDYISAESKDLMRRFDTVMPGSTEFTPVFDDEGNLLDTFFAQNTDDESLTKYLPQPHVGHYLFAHRSNLDCESQQVAIGRSQNARNDLT